MYGILLAAAVIVMLGLLGARYGADSRTDMRLSSGPPAAPYRREYYVRDDVRVLLGSVRRLARCFLGAQRRQNASHEPVLERQRVPRRRPLRWVRGADGWRLDGDHLQERPSASRR
ncbi:MAG: hypothetical protein ACR2F6_05610 [Mycobacteriales bacterium]